MATGDTLIPKLFHGAMRSDNPNPARREYRQYFDPTTNTVIKREVLVFPNSGDGIGYPEIIDEFIVPTQYANTTGLTLYLVLAPELPIIAGVARFELAVENILTGASSTKVITLDYWGTPATGDLTVQAVSGEVLISSIALVKGAIGGDTPAAGTVLPPQMWRLRLRRINDHANDTLVGNALVLATQLRET